MNPALDLDWLLDDLVKRVRPITSAVVLSRDGLPLASCADLSREEIRERMSGNLCRCACYPNIVDAVTDAVARR